MSLIINNRLYVRRTREMDSQGTDKNSRVSRMTVGAFFRIAVPCILIGGALGAMIGSALGDIANHGDNTLLALNVSHRS